MVPAAALLLAGCDKATTLHAGLEEQQANLVMAALLDAGITCSKEAGEEGTWNVMVSEQKFAAAVNLLERKGLPRRAHMGIGEVFKKTGMISLPSEERIRFMDALAQDLGATLMSLRRTKIGKLSVDDAIPFDKLLETDVGNLPSCVVPISRALR